MEIKISKIDNLHIVTINGKEIPNVEKYKISTSESGETEVELKIKADASIISVEMSIS